MNAHAEEILPIAIIVAQPLLELFKKIEGIGERLSAQLNFQAMTCGWFGDEDTILTWAINIDTGSSFDNKKCLLQAEQDEFNEFVSFSDDVCFAHKKAVNHLNVLVSITDKELELLQANSKILKRYLDTKITKVVNLVANRLQLEPLPTE